jgi:hypothetical protein
MAGAEPAAERPWLQERIGRLHRIQVQEPPGEDARLPPACCLTFTARDGALVAHRPARQPPRRAGEDGEPGTGPTCPVDSATVRVGFPASRVDVQPWLAMLLILSVGTVVTLITSAWLARWLIGRWRAWPATQRIGQGRRPEPLAEAGPAELATLAREFNRMGVQVEELLANRTTLLAGISHDLRTPLARIRLALGMLSEKPDRDLIERIMRDVDGMNELIARCLEVSRDFAEQDSVANQPVRSARRGGRPSSRTPASKSAAARGPTATCACGRWRSSASSPTWSTTPCATAQASRSTSNTASRTAASRSACSTAAPAFPKRSARRCSAPSIASSPRAAAAPAAADWGWPSCASSPMPTAGRWNCGTRGGWHRRLRAGAAGGIGSAQTARSFSPARASVSSPLAKQKRMTRSSRPSR